MNKKILSAGVLGALLFGSFDANAMYIGAGFGVSKNKVKSQIDSKKFSSNGAYSIAAGYTLPVPVLKPRVELEYSDLLASEDDESVKTRGMALNAFVNIPVLPVVTPYAGLGVGYFRQELGDWKSDWRVLPQYMAGLDLSVPFTPLAFSAEYRLIDTSFDYDHKNSYVPNTSLDSKIESVLVKGRVSF